MRFLALIFVMGFKWGEQLPRRPKATLPSLLFVLSRDLTLTLSLTLTLNATLTLTQLTEETRRRRLFIQCKPAVDSTSRPTSGHPPTWSLPMAVADRCRWPLPIVQLLLVGSPAVDNEREVICAAF